jgi:pimeloyl-ACP methyl ester carboxylesterase
MWGLRDWCFSVEFLAEFVRRFPNAQTVTFEHAGHYLFEDEKGQYVAHIERFLNGLSR